LVRPRALHGVEAGGSSPRHRAARRSLLFAEMPRRVDETVRLCRLGARVVVAVHVVLDRLDRGVGVERDDLRHAPGEQQRVPRCRVNGWTRDPLQYLSQRSSSGIKAMLRSCRRIALRPPSLSCCFTNYGTHTPSTSSRSRRMPFVLRRRRFPLLSCPRSSANPINTNAPKTATVLSGADTCEVATTVR